MNAADWGLALTLGGASSLHCAGMCGPVVAAYSAAVPRGTVLPHLAYNGGRILTYSLLGVLAGAAGEGAGWLGHIAGIERWAAVGGGLLMLMAGLALLGVARGTSLVQIGGDRRLPQRLIRRITPFLVAPSAASKFGLGLGLGLLPCGLVYAALAKAATTGSPIDGALTMAAFGTGTAGALLAVALLSAGFRQKLARHGTRVAAAGVILLGLIAIGRGAYSALHYGAAEEASCHARHGS